MDCFSSSQIHKKKRIFIHILCHTKDIRMSIQKKEGSCFDWIRSGKLQAALIECQRSIKLGGFSKLCGDSFLFSLSVFKASMFLPLNRRKVLLCRFILCLQRKGNNDLLASATFSNAKESWRKYVLK